MSKNTKNLLTKYSYIVFGLVYGVIAFLPHLGVIKFGVMSTFAYIAIYTVVALGLNLLLGFSGLISLGTAGFVGFGALTMGIFLTRGFPFEVAVLIVLVATAIIGGVIGLFSLKVDGIYLAIATLFVGEIFLQIFTTVPIFGGNAIQIGTIRLFGFWDLSMIKQWDRSILFLILTVAMVIIMIIMHNIIHSKTGRALMAMSRSEHAAQAMGISLLRYRLIAFITASLFAAMGGILYSLYFQSVTTSEWNLNVSLIIIAMVVVGGFKSIYGTFIGAIIIYGVPTLILQNIFGDVGYIFSGILIIIVIIFYPNGLGYVGYSIKAKWRKYKIKREVPQDES